MAELVADTYENATGARPVVYWYTTFRCNLSCKHCWIRGGPGAEWPDELTADQMIETVAKLERLHPSRVILTGGEPLLKRGLPAVLERMNESRLDYAIESNGMLMTADLARILRNGIENGSRISVAVSLDGGDAETHDWLRGPGSFRAALRGIDHLRAAAIPVSVQCVIHRNNQHTLGRLMDVLMEHDVDLVKVVLANPVGRGADNYDELGIDFEHYEETFANIAEALERFSGRAVVKTPPAAIPPKFLGRLFPSYTGAPQRVNQTSCAFPLLGFLPNGKITTCAMTRDIEMLDFGHVATADLNRVWGGRDFEAMRGQYHAAALEGTCSDCVFLSTCKGSCRAHAAAEFGSLSAPHPLCAKLDALGYFPEIYRSSYRTRLLAAGR